MIAYVKIPNNEDILSIMSNLQPNCCLKVDFQKVDQHAGGKWLIHDTKRRKTNHKWCDGTMLNPIFWKKVQGQKHPVRWGIVKHQIPSIKVLFKTNTKSHRHASIRLFMREQDTIGKPKKTKSGIQPRNRTLPRNTETQSFWVGTQVIRRKRIQPTGFGACSSTCCQWVDGEDVPAPWERSNSDHSVRVQNSYVNQFI